MCTELQNTYKVEFPRMSDYEKLKMRHVKLDLNSIPAYDDVIDLNSIPAYDDEPGETQFQRMHTEVIHSVYNQAILQEKKRKEACWDTTSPWIVLFIAGVLSSATWF